MSGIPRSRKLWITPLSPVHMGTDEDYTPAGYVIEGNALYEFDERALEGLPEAQRADLRKLLGGKPSDAMLKQVQAFFYKNREWLIPGAVNVVQVSEEVAKLYAARIGKAANVESGGREVQNKLEIERAAYNSVDRRLFFPGTGLKGAMRTALLDCENDGNPLPQKYRDPKARDGSGIARGANNKLQKDLFKGSFETDPMRLVQVGDCAWCGPENLNSAEILFAVNRKKHPVEDEHGKPRPAQDENLSQLFECAAPFRFRAFQGLLTVSDVGAAGERNHKLPHLRFGFAEIAAACNRFYRPIFEKETELLKKHGFLDTQWRETVERLLDDSAVKERLARNQAFLLRVGRHSGAESVTLNGVRTIRVMRGKKEKPVWEPEAKTLWLATGSHQDKRYLRPFGWLLVEMTEPDENPPTWPEAEALLEQYTEASSRWLEKVHACQAELTEKQRNAREQAELRAREEAEARRRQAEEERRKAAMSPEERQIEALRALFEKEKAQGRLAPQGPVSEQRLKLLKAALEWEDPQARCQAGRLLEMIARELNWPKKRRDEAKSQVRRLLEKCS